MRAFALRGGGGHAPPAFEPSEDSFRDIARLVPFSRGRRFVRWARARMTASMLCRAWLARKASTQVRSALRQDHRGASV